MSGVVTGRQQSKLPDAMTSRPAGPRIFASVPKGDAWSKAEYRFLKAIKTEWPKSKIVRSVTAPFAAMRHDLFIQKLMRSNILILLEHDGFLTRAQTLQYRTARSAGIQTFVFRNNAFIRVWRMRQNTRFPSEDRHARALVRNRPVVIINTPTEKQLYPSRRSGRTCPRTR